ncbi:MAG: DUF2019 domain-containing protein [Bacteroidales bacterium]|nr:DUF2019 domain-containing protein [Bacteroidales bacterium]
MKRVKLSTLSTDELVERFAEIGLAQDEAIWEYRSAEYNHLYMKMEAVRDELRARSGDQRRLLVRLLDHVNPQVRLKAAISVLALEPVAARSVLEALYTSQFPQRLDAGPILRGLDSGSFVPT